MKSRVLLILLIGFIFPSCQQTGSSETTEGKEDMDLGAATAETAPKPRKIIFFGDSLTAAYGLDPGEGYPALIQERLNELGFQYKVVNAGLSGETTAGGNERVEWVLQQDVDVFVLALGGNDGLRGIDPDVTYQNLQSIIEKVRSKAPEADIILAGMEAPPNMGEEYTNKFRQVYPRLADANDLALIPFLLADVGGIPALNLPDGIHPNQEGQRIVAENVWKVLQPLLKNQES